MTSLISGPAQRLLVPHCPERIIARTFLMMASSAAQSLQVFDALFWAPLEPKYFTINHL